MTATELASRLAEAFPGKVEAVARSPKRLYVGIAAGDLRGIVAWLGENVPGLRLATSTGIDLREGVGVFHHFAINGQALVVTLKVIAPKPDPVVPSLAPTLAAAAWIEREMHDLLGVRFEGHPDLRRLVKAAAFPDVFPLRRDFDPAAFKESIGERPAF